MDDLAAWIAAQDTRASERAKREAAAGALVDERAREVLVDDVEVDLSTVVGGANASITPTPSGPGGCTPKRAKPPTRVITASASTLRKRERAAAIKAGAPKLNRALSWPELAPETQRARLYWLSLHKREALERAGVVLAARESAWLPTNQAASYLGISVPHLSRLARRGFIGRRKLKPARKRSSSDRYEYRRSALKALAISREHKRSRVALSA